MRIVIFSDIHGNVVALEAVLAEIRRQAAPDALFIAGDLVLLGPRPAETLALLRSIDGARFVKGNTDQYLIDYGDDVDTGGCRQRRHAARRRPTRGLRGADLGARRVADRASPR